MSNFRQKLTTLRREFHQDPELGFQLQRTKARVVAYLSGLGLEVHEGAGVVGVLRAGSSKRIIGLRADMDALPITEQSTHAYVSAQPGVMHACGHDGHTTMLLGAAELLSDAPDFDGTVVFIFQPDEEHGRGARALIEEGLLTRFPLDEVYAIHNLPGAPLGQLSSRIGQICASESLFEITIKGRGGHASMPQAGADALTVGAEMVLSLQTIVSRKLAPGAGAVVSVTEFITDGQRNVLPGHVSLKGDVRARVPADRRDIERFMKQLVHGVAAAHGINASMRFSTEFIETINARVPTEAVLRTAEGLGLDTRRDCAPMSFSEDFAHLSAAVPGCFMVLGNGTTGPQAEPLHAANYDFNDALLTIGAGFWAALVRDRLPVLRPASQENT